ncbi:hypothetical protein INT47_008291 [Mucor saturninus]|uniref:Transcription activator GCR1-like domain-containing protein n=1 Tax=Mucor saturninus TaxID=64648 RepID=A0A8H7RF13_9FUNG|nr:hypothetical protein INT47_008291 [Mucor saturninus]
MSNTTQRNTTESSNVPANPSISRHPSSTFRLSTGVYTVTDLYREWKEGLGGNHSVEFMNTSHPGWYSSQKSFYMRRRKIIKACEEYAVRKDGPLKML